MGSVLLIFSFWGVFLWGGLWFFFLLCVFAFLVPCCGVRYDFSIKTMFGLSLPQVVCRRAHVLFTLFVFVFFFLRIVVSNTYCVVFFFFLSSSYVLNVASFSGLHSFYYSFGVVSHFLKQAKLLLSLST